MTPPTTPREALRALADAVASSSDAATWLPPSAVATQIREFADRYYPEAASAPTPATRVGRLCRTKDVTGVSGTGHVAEVVQFPDGVTVVRWCGDRPSTVIWDSIDAAMAVHGHGGATTIEWDC